MARNENFINLGSERALIATILKCGKDAFIDSQGILAASDFHLPINKVIYSALENLANDKNCIVFDTEAVKLKVASLGLDDFIKTNKDIEYLELLNSGAFPRENVELFSYQIKKLSIIRALYRCYSDAQKYLDSITGDEDLSLILAKAEGYISDFVAGVDNKDSLELLSEGIEEYMEEMINTEPVDQVGLPTGFPQWDQAIGGGPRPGTISVIGSRSKVGKSWMGMNMGLNVARRGIPVLYVDSELTNKYQKDRLISIESGCPIQKWETRKFQKDLELVKNVRDSAARIKGLPLTYKSISGMSPAETLLYVRRWLVKNVGFNNLGQANDCCIIYDYLKLTSGDALTKFTPEWILLGLAITEIHNFAVKYNVPFITFVQLNRDGIDNLDTGIVAGSDRILWLCSSLSILRNKDNTDQELGCGWEHGNKKLTVLETRQGAGLMDGDYINLHASLKPMVTEDVATGYIEEGFRFSEISAQNRATN